MSSSRLWSFACFAAAAAAAWGAYETRVMPLVSAGLALLCAVLIGLGWTRAGKANAVDLHDPAVSTLVFPPESKFRQSELPRR